MRHVTVELFLLKKTTAWSLRRSYGTLTGSSSGLKNSALTANSRNTTPPMRVTKIGRSIHEKKKDTNLKQRQFQLTSPHGDLLRNHPPADDGQTGADGVSNHATDNHTVHVFARRQDDRGELRPVTK